MANPYAKSIVMGVVAGMRCFSAPAIVSSHFLREHSPEIEESNLAFMANPKMAGILQILAAGELIADKTPWIPNRTDPGPLLARAASGAVCAAAICTAGNKRADLGAVIGGLAAIISAHSCFLIRRRLTVKNKIPDHVIALAEDAIVQSSSLSLS